MWNPRMKPGRLLTAEESIRLAVIDSAERQDLIAHIAAGLRAKERAKSGRLPNLRKRKREAR